MASIIQGQATLHATLERPMTAPPLDCLCAGIVVADHVCDPVDRLPAPGELVLARRMDLTIGGCAANVAVDLARLGRRSAVAGCVGGDMFGRFARETLAAGGVDCDGLRQVAGRDTSGTLIVNTRGEDRRFIHSIGANNDFTGTEVTAGLLKTTRVLYLGGYCLCDGLTTESTVAMFKAAREVGVSTVLDVVLPGAGDFRRRLEPVLRWTDVFLPNSDEARLITGLDDPLAQAEELRRWGAATVVITCGREGAVLVSDANRVRSGGHAVEFVDGTGSGDAFAAGYIHALLNGRDELECLRYGSALGASCVRACGATTGVFDAAELARFLELNELAVAST